MSEYAVVIRRGPKCKIAAGQSHLIPRTISATVEEAEKERDQYQRNLAAWEPGFARHCRYVVVELREVS